MRSTSKAKELVKPKKLYGRAAGGIFFKRLKKSKKSTDSSLSSPIIGWDDVNCRPVFDGISASRLSRLDEQPLKETLGNELRSESRHWNGRRKNKSYKTFKKETFFISTKTFATTQSRKFNAKPAEQESREKSFQFSSPAPQERICRNLDSHTKSDKVKEEARNLSSRVVSLKKKSGCEIRQTQPKSKLNGLTQFNFTEETTKTILKQPNFKTDISAAKVFFDSLDATEALVVVSNSPTPPQVQSKCGRSYRKINLDDNALQHEYDSYRKASYQSGVEPLSIVEFAKNRSNIFRPNEMFDGFLDG